MNRLRTSNARPGILILALLLLTILLVSCSSDDPAAPADTNGAPTVPTIDTASGAPADGATNIVLATDLHWTCTDPDGDPLTYAVHFGTEATPPAVSEDQDASSYTPAGLANGTTYYWQIMAADDAKSTSSPIWSFTTVTPASETISTPTTPSGPTATATSENQSYSTSGAISSEGHDVEYRFDWGDGTRSDWAASGDGTHAWVAAGDYDVTAQARCATHPEVESTWSTGLVVTIAPAAETLSAPGTPTGDSIFTVGTSGSFSTTPAYSSLGHTVEYRFDWGDGIASAWSPTRSSTRLWSTAGVYVVRAEARCQEHPTVGSTSYQSLSVTVQAAETISTPNAPDGPTDGETDVQLYYVVSGAESSLGHGVEYRVDWGNGLVTSWFPTPNHGNSWPAPGTYEIVTQARCIDHPTVESAWSAPTTLVISLPAEQITVPGLSTHAQVGGVGDQLEFSVYGGNSNLDHPTELQFDWGDGTYSDWGPKDGLHYTRSHAWATVGTYQVTARARCIEHPEYVSDWMAAVSVDIMDSETVSAPSLTLEGEVTWPVGRYGGGIYARLSESSLGHDVEYQFEVNGTLAEWVPAYLYTLPTDVPIDYYIKAHARCVEDTEIVSDWSATTLIHVVAE